MSDGGKGSAPRPFSVSNQEYAERWDAIFGRDGNETKKNGQPLPQTLKDNVEDYLESQKNNKRNLKVPFFINKMNPIFYLH